MENLKNYKFSYKKVKKPEAVSGGNLWPLGWVEDIFQKMIYEDIKVKDLFQPSKK